MAYATTADIQNEIPQITFTATSKPSVVQIQESIVLIEAHVNAVLKSRGYTTPIPPTAPESTKILQKIVRHGVAAEVLRQMQTSIRDVSSTGRSEHQRIYDEMLRDVFLPDVSTGPASDPFYIAGPTYDDDAVFQIGDVF